MIDRKTWDTEAGIWPIYQRRISSESKYAKAHSSVVITILGFGRSKDTAERWLKMAYVKWLFLEDNYVGADMREWKHSERGIFHLPTGLMFYMMSDEEWVLSSRTDMWCDGETANGKMMSEAKVVALARQLRVVFRELCTAGVAVCGRPRRHPSKCELA
jgi:hypothetical protein